MPGGAGRGGDHEKRKPEKTHGHLADDCFTR